MGAATPIDPMTKCLNFRPDREMVFLVAYGAKNGTKMGTFEKRGLWPPGPAGFAATGYSTRLGGCS